MAEVWRASVAYSADVSKVVALKMIREDLVRVPHLLSLFIDEARITSRISHANVAQVFDFGEEEGRPYLAMELVDGPDLETILARAKELGQHLPLAFCAHVLAEIARGLAAAHGLTDEQGAPYGIVHRDVSPQNVLVSYAGEVKLTDFGIARARDKLTQTETGTVMGKFRYMSPEQVQGRPLDARSDIFSCGILLYELLTGIHLFDGRTSAEVVDQIRYKELPDLLALRRDVDPALETMLRWALERDRDARCPDAATLARDLERYIHVGHPQFTRDEVVQLVLSLLPRHTPGRVGQIAFAGTELAAEGGGADSPLEGTGLPSPQTTAEVAPEARARTTRPGQRKRTLAGTGSEPGPVAQMGPGKAAAPSPIPRPAPPPQGGSTAPLGTLSSSQEEEEEEEEEEGIPLTPMSSPSTVAFDGSFGPRSGIAGGGPQPRPAIASPDTSPSESAPREQCSREPTASLPGRSSLPLQPPGGPGTSTASPDAPSPGPNAPSLAEELTAALGGDDPDATAPTRRAPSLPRAEADLGQDAALETTHTISPGAREGIPSPAPRRKRLRVTLSLALGALLLGGAALGILRPWEPRHQPSREDRLGATEPGAPRTPPRGAMTGQISKDATLDATSSQDRLEAIDRELAALPLLRDLRDPAIGRTLANAVAFRLMHATVDAEGQRELGPPPPQDQGLPAGERHTRAFTAAMNLLAERILLSEELPERARDILAPLPSEALTSQEVLARIHGTALHVIAAPRSARAQEIHIMTTGLGRGWRPPLAGRDGRRFLFPHLVVARDAVTRLLELSPENALGRSLRRYIEAHPRGKPARGGDLHARLTEVRRLPLKKAPHVKLDLTLTLKAASGHRPVTLEPALWRLHGIGPEPLPPSYWEPEQVKALANGEAATLTLTFAEPLGPPPPALVLSVAQPGGGALWLQVESRLLP